MFEGNFGALSSLTKCPSYTFGAGIVFGGLKADLDVRNFSTIKNHQKSFKSKLIGTKRTIKFFCTKMKGGSMPILGNYLIFYCISVNKFQKLIKNIPFLKIKFQKSREKS